MWICGKPAWCGFSKGLRKTRSVFQGPAGGCGKRDCVTLRMTGRRGRVFHDLPQGPAALADPHPLSANQAWLRPPRIRIRSGEIDSKGVLRGGPGGVGPTSRTGCPLGGTSSASLDISFHPSSSGRLKAASGASLLRVQGTAGGRPSERLLCCATLTIPTAPVGPPSFLDQPGVL